MNSYTPYIPILATCPLFANVESCELEQLLQSLDGVQREYKKNSFLFYSGDSLSALGVVLSGSVHILQEDFWGNRTIVGRIGNGEIFGETFAAVGDATMTVDVMAAETAVVLYLEIKNILQPCSTDGALNQQLLQNLLQIFATKNLVLTEKMNYLSQRSTRQKVLIYLARQSQKNGADYFNIPFNRQQLADYLAVDRSALSAELGRLREEGILDFCKSHFTLYRTDPGE